MSVLACLVPLIYSAAATATPIPVILDTDLGDDIDDTWALAMLLGCPQLDIKLIVTASGDTEAKTRLVAKYLERVGRTDIPIGTGVKTSENPINQQKWLGDYSLKDYPGVIHEDGVEAMIKCIEDSSSPVTLIVIGPQTNIRAALDTDPLIAKRARVVMMAGGIHKGYGGSDTPVPEWNVHKDVEAARAVFAAPWPITMAPLDVCGELILKDFRYEHVSQSETPRAVALMENYDQWANRDQYPENQSSVLFDTVAIYLAYDESLCRMETVNLSIDDDGLTRFNERGGRPVNCALGWKDKESFEDLLATTVTGHEAEKPKE